MMPFRQAFAAAVRGQGAAAASRAYASAAPQIQVQTQFHVASELIRLQQLASPPSMPTHAKALPPQLYDFNKIEEQMLVFGRSNTQPIVVEADVVGFEAARNNRKPKKANHGKRPCSRWARRLKKNRLGTRRRRG